MATRTTESGLFRCLCSWQNSNPSGERRRVKFNLGSNWIKSNIATKCVQRGSLEIIFFPLPFCHQQFFKHEFTEIHEKTSKPFRYRSCLVCDTMIRELTVLDVPPQVSLDASVNFHLFFIISPRQLKSPSFIFSLVVSVNLQKKFPIDNLAEWNSNNNRPLGLRNMHLYVLVFDMGNLETFQYCRSMREQILSSFSHRNFSIIVVGNKYDLIADSPNYSQVRVCHLSFFFFSRWSFVII